MSGMVFLDFCSGIGGFRLGMERAGHKCIGFCEKDHYAVRSYRAMFDTKGEWFSDDVTTLDAGDIPSADIWCFGFPCQDISVAGRRGGIRAARSGIYFSIIDLVKSKAEKDKPSYLVIENVKHLLSINSGFDFASVLLELDQAGYDAFWQVLNSKDFGIPQNRERVYIIANIRSRGGREILPFKQQNPSALKQLAGGCQGNRVYDSKGLSCTIVGNSGGAGAKTGLYLINRCEGGIRQRQDFTCLDANYAKGLDCHQARTGVLEIRQDVNQIDLTDRNPALEPGIPLCHSPGSNERNILADGFNDPGSIRIRRLTPRECFRLQGFPDELFEKARSVNSDHQLYKQAGNAVTVNVARAVAEKINYLETQ